MISVRFGCNAKDFFYKNLLNKLQNGSENTYPDLCIDNQKLLPAKLEIEKLQAFVLLAREQAFLFSKIPVQKIKKNSLLQPKG